MKTEHQIVQLAASFAHHRGLTISTVSTYAANDGKWICGLKEGASCTLRKAGVVLQWFSDNWPDEELSWPIGIERPAKNKKRKAA